MRVIQRSRSGYSRLEPWIARQAWYFISQHKAGMYICMLQWSRNGRMPTDILIPQHSCDELLLRRAYFLCTSQAHFGLPFHGKPWMCLLRRVSTGQHRRPAEIEKRGFTYVPWANKSTKDGRTSYQSRTLSDMSCLFIKTSKTPSIKSGQEVIDVEWCLGGRVSTSSLTFVYPQTKAVRNRL